MTSRATTKSRKAAVMASVSPVLGAGLTIAGWVVVANVAWQLLAGLTQAMLCELRSRRPLECLPAWSQMGEIGRRSTDTLLALVVHSPAESAVAAMGGVAGGVVSGATTGRGATKPKAGRSPRTRTQVNAGPPDALVPAEHSLSREESSA
jgi:hypothetical protein